MVTKVISHSANILFNQPTASNSMLTEETEIEIHILWIETCVEESMEWTDADEPMETDEIEFQYEMDCLCRRMENLKISP